MRPSKTPEYRKEYQRRWAEQNPDRVRSNHFKKRYGVSLEELETRLENQNHQCLICSKEIKLRGVKGRDCAVVDHCHTSKIVRGLLCTPCNLMIGYSKDNVATLKAAITYLEKQH